MIDKIQIETGKMEEIKERIRKRYSIPPHDEIELVSARLEPAGMLLNFHSFGVTVRNVLLHDWEWSYKS